MMKQLLKLVSLLALLTSCAGFSTAPLSTKLAPHSMNVAEISLARSKTSFSPHLSRATTSVYATNLGTEEESTGGLFSGVSINAPYLVAYVIFLGFAFFKTMTEQAGASNDILQQFLADPLNPGCNELFVTIFNLLGLYFIPMACLLMPGAKNQKFPATPFLVGSMLGGYGLLGPYAFTRTPDATIKTKADLGWVTANILENKIFNWFIAVAFISAYITSGGVNALLSDASGTIDGYLQLFSETAIASASSVDFLILTLSAASWIPEDLQRRNYDGKLAPALIAASTVLLPGVGVALYCALRPSLDEE
ncbi:hypothetical protein ACHAXM_008767 [Skeletonema potamos]